MKKKIAIGLSLLLILSAVMYFSHQSKQSAEIPDIVPRTGGSTAGAEYLNVQHAAEFYREEIRKNPDVVKNYVELAQVFLQESRATGNHRVRVRRTV